MEKDSDMAIKIMEEEVIVVPDAVNSVAIAREIALKKTKSGKDSAFVVLNLDKVIDLYNTWTRELPTIVPFYAVKCNTDRRLLQTLAALGAGFDCASKDEIDMVLNIGVPPERIIYANTCKAITYINHARLTGVRRMTADSSDELAKIALHFPEAEIVLRIAVSDPAAVFKFEKKFGVQNTSVAHDLMILAKKLGLSIVGISFHVGSGSRTEGVFEEGIKVTRTLFDIGKSIGFDMKLLDIGGGFPGNDEAHFCKITRQINIALRQYFPLGDVEIIAEPGRYFAATPNMTVANIIHTRTVMACHITENARDNGIGIMYYLNDGKHGGLNFCYQEYSDVHEGKPLMKTNADETICIVWGPTCSSHDIIEDKKLKPLMKIGDWVYYENTGAYTKPLATQFNGFPISNTFAFISEENWIRCEPQGSLKNGNF